MSKIRPIPLPPEYAPLKLALWNWVVVFQPLVEVGSKEDCALFIELCEGLSSQTVAVLMVSALPTVPGGMVTVPTEGVPPVPVVSADAPSLPLPENWKAARVASASAAQPATASTPRRRQNGPPERSEGRGDHDGAESRISAGRPAADITVVGAASRVRLRGSTEVGSAVSSCSRGSERITSASSLTEVIAGADSSPMPRARRTAVSTCLGTAARTCAGLYGRSSASSRGAG